MTPELKAAINGGPSVIVTLTAPPKYKFPDTGKNIIQFRIASSQRLFMQIVRFDSATEWVFAVVFVRDLKDVAIYVAEPIPARLPFSDTLLTIPGAELEEFLGVSESRRGFGPLVLGLSTDGGQCGSVQVAISYRQGIPVVGPLPVATLLAQFIP